eukprot:Skav227585  [mRNA]  locus=scaffold1141:76844:81220:+ [translate_table: standard]
MQVPDMRVGCTATTLCGRTFGPAVCKPWRRGSTIQCQTRRLGGFCERMRETADLFAYCGSVHCHPDLCMHLLPTGVRTWVACGVDVVCDMNVAGSQRRQWYSYLSVVSLFDTYDLTWTHSLLTFELITSPQWMHNAGAMASSSSGCPLRAETTSSTDGCPMRSTNSEVLNPRNMMPEMPQTPAASQSMDLKKDREVSSIPKTGEAGNWVYPSSQQFYHALLRKNKEAEAEAWKE